MRIISTEEIRSRQRLAFHAKVPIASGRWHEGVEAVGYWQEADSFVFKVGGHYVCITRPYIELIATGKVNFDDTSAD